MLFVRKRQGKSEDGHTDRRTGKRAKHNAAPGGEPALSNALSRLCVTLQDQLFIRKRYGVQPTAVALELAPVIAEALARLDNAVCGQQELDPQRPTGY